MKKRARPRRVQSTPEDRIKCFEKLCKAISDRAVKRITLYAFQLFNSCWHLDEYKDIREILLKHDWPNLREWRTTVKQRNDDFVVDSYIFIIAQTLNRLGYEI